MYKVAAGESKSGYPFQEIKRIYLFLCWKKKEKNGAVRYSPHFIIAVLLFPFFSRIYLQRFYDIERRIERKKKEIRSEGIKHDDPESRKRLGAGNKKKKVVLFSFPGWQHGVGKNIFRIFSNGYWIRESFRLSLSILLCCSPDCMNCVAHVFLSFFSFLF